MTHVWLVDRRDDDVCVCYSSAWRSKHTMLVKMFASSDFLVLGLSMSWVHENFEKVQRRCYVRVYCLVA